LDEEEPGVFSGLFGFGDDGAHALPVGDNMAVNDFVVGGAGVTGLFDEGGTDGEVFTFAVDVESDVLTSGGFPDELVDFGDSYVTEL
jgi:hypothetical protein